MEPLLHCLSTNLKERIMKQKTLIRSLIAAGVIAAGVGGYAKFDPTAFHQAAAATIAARSASTVALPDFTGIVAQNGMAVVNISVTNKADKVAGVPAMPKLDPNDPFYQFFRQFRVPMPQEQMPTQGLRNASDLSIEMAWFLPGKLRSRSLIAHESRSGWLPRLNRRTARDRSALRPASFGRMSSQV